MKKQEEIEVFKMTMTGFRSEILPTEKEKKEWEDQFKEDEATVNKENYISISGTPPMPKKYKTRVTAEFEFTSDLNIERMARQFSSHVLPYVN